MNTLMFGCLSFIELRNLVGFAVVCGVCFAFFCVTVAVRIFSLNSC